MTKYKVMASEGSFAANQRQAPDQSQKIVDAANKKIRGMEKAHSFEMQQRDIYLRAMKFAQSQEEQSRERNFKLETENRQAHINVVKQDYQNARTASQQMEQASIQNSEKMKGLFDLVPQFAEMYAANVERQDKEDRQAASVAAYEHGFTMDTLENVLALNDQLSLSQFQATDYIQSLREENGWSEDRINALYEYQYKTRGSKAWVDNVALANNSIEEFKYGLSTQLVENGALTPEQQIDAVRGYTQDFIGNISINGRPISAEVMSTIIAPKVRSAETRALNGLQKQRVDTRNAALTTEKNKVYANAFRLKGPAGMHAINGLNPSKDKRDELINFAINAHKSGVFSTDDLRDFFDSKFEIEATGKVDTLAGHFLGDDKVADLSTYLQQVESAEDQKFRDDENKNLRETRALITETINEYLKTGETVTPEFIEELKKLGIAKAGVKFQSDEIDYIAEYYTKNAQMKEVSMDQGEIMVDNGATLEELIVAGFGQSLLNTETDTGQSLQERARVNEKARTSKYFKKGNDAIASYIKEHENIKANSFVRKKGLSYEIDYQQKQYRELYFDFLKRNGGDEIEADTMAQAQIKDEINKYLNSNEIKDKGLTREENSIPPTLARSEKFKLRQLKFQDYYTNNVSLGIVAQQLGKKLFMDSVEALQSPIKEVPPEFASVATIYNKTPFEFATFIAPAFGKDAPEFDATTLQTYRETFTPERMPLLRNPYGTAMRPYRATSSASTAARRGSFAIPTPAGQQTPAWSAAGSVLKFAEGVTSKGSMYNVKFGGSTFDDYSRHPDEVMTSSGLNSAAAGAYQFMPSTWKGVSEKLGLKDFGPEAQEMAGRELTAGRGVDPDRVYTSFEDFNNNFLIPLAPEWASLPKADGKSYYKGQSAKSARRLWEYYQQALKQFGVN